MSTSAGPRFSVLLPTRNGGSRLHTCVRSVLDQPWDDFELVVADNASDEETKEALAASAGDPRLTVTRSSTVLPLTDNWNRALEQSSGKYLMLLGDDDLLLPRYFATADARLREHGEPDCLTCNGYVYVFPEPGGPSYYRDPAFVEPDFDGGTVPPEARRGMVKEFFRGFGFDPGFSGFQRTLVSRRALGTLPKGLFRPPYPDLYAMAALLVSVPRWAYVPDQLIVLGISVGSFTQLTLSGRPDRAVERLALHGDSEPPPGNPMLKEMLANLEALKRDFPERFAEMRINEPHYRLRQLWGCLRQAKAGNLPWGGVWSAVRGMTVRDWLRIPVALTQRETWRAAYAAVRVHLRPKSRISIERFKPLPGVGDIGEFAEWIEARRTERVLSRRSPDVPAR